MNNEHGNEQLLVKYLLGQLSREEELQVEEGYFVNDELHEELQAVEIDLIDRYVRNELSKDERERFEKRFLAAPDRVQDVMFAKTLKDYLSKPAAEELPGWPDRIQELGRKLRLFFTPLRSVTAAVLALALVLVVLTWQEFIFESQEEKGLNALRSAYQSERPVEARLSALDYAPFSSTRGSGQENIDHNNRNRAERTLLDNLNERPSPEAHHAVGLLYLAKKDIQAAINEFNLALASAPDDSRIHSDLGAALLEKGKIELSSEAHGKALEEFSNSLEHLNKAIELDGSNLEALFNRALLYQQMNLRKQAVDDWRKYLELDSTSQWAEEARRNLASLEQKENRSSKNSEQLLQDFLQAYQARDDEVAWRAFSQSRTGGGNFIVTRLLDDYLDLARGGRENEAGEKLQSLFYVAELELQTARDSFTFNLARFYSTARHRFSELAQARDLIKKGNQYYDQSDLENAIDHYNKARVTLESAGNVCEAKYVQYRLGHCYLMQSKSAPSLAVFEKLAQDCEAAHYKWLLAQSLYSIANVQVGLNNYSAAIDSSTRCLEISGQINDSNGVARAMQQLAQEYVYLNNYHGALDLHHQTLALSHDIADPLFKWRCYFYIAIPLNRLGLYAAAVEYQKEALRLAQEIGRPQVICRSYIHLGLMYGDQHNYEEAIQTVQIASDLGEKLPSRNARMENAAYSSLQVGNLYRRAGEFDKAIASYDQAIGLYSELDFQAFNYMAHKGKLLSCLARGGCSSVEQEVETTLGLFEKYRSKILEESNRNTFFDIEQDVYDLAIDFEYSQKNNVEAAFEYSERSRARTLFDLINTDTRIIKDGDVRFPSVYEPLKLERLLERLPEQVQILQYAALNDKLVIWVLSRKGVTSRQSNISLTEMDRMVKEYLRFISRPSATAKEGSSDAAKGLYRVLIEPVESLLDKRKQLCIVPDKILNSLPYGALVSPSGKYLLEDHAIIYSPSSNLFVVSSESASARESNKPERLLAVGNPRFDSGAFPALADLPSAQTEARTIATYYSSSNVILGDKATKKRSLDYIGESDVAHFALHAVVDERSPIRSKLLLAKEQAASASSQESDGALQAGEIYKLKLPRTRLVVLSACRSGVERYYAGEGMMGLSRSFVAAKVPLVVASQWNVDTDSTAELMKDFHRRRKLGNLSTAEALRGAQLAMLHGQVSAYRQPYYWASFIVIGGYARF